MKIKKIEKQSVLEQFDAFIIDEAHHAKSMSITAVAERCKNAGYRVGMSATYEDEYTADWYSVVGSLGPVRNYTTYKKLEEDDYITGLEINNIIMNYNYKVRTENFYQNRNDYFSEVNFLNANIQRNDFITKLTDKMKENTLVLFTKIDHGNDLYNRMLAQNKRVFYIDGSVKVEEREIIRRLMETNNNVVLIASFGTFAEGVNVKNIHNIVFASNYKSKIKIIQSIGRGLRKQRNKEQLKIFDIIDDLRMDSEDYVNYSLKHYRLRQRVYKKQGFENIKYIKIKV